MCHALGSATHRDYSFRSSLYQIFERPGIRLDAGEITGEEELRKQGTLLLFLILPKLALLALSKFLLIQLR